MPKILPLVLVLLLSGCDALMGTSLKGICEDYPQMCSDLNQDGWCRAEKASIIQHRYQHLKNPSDMAKYRLLLDFEEYKKCVSKAAQIEHIKLKDKKSGRIMGMITAERELKQLARDTENSSDPHLLYYHWTRFGDERHLQGFLRFEGLQQLETHEMQVALASYYVKFDLEKTVRILYHALELYRDDEELNTEIFSSLTSIFMKLEDYPQAYIWAYVANEFGIEHIDLAQMADIARQSGANVDQLTDIAEDYADAINSQQFASPQWDQD